jgi:riboflavin biosynthesis pyrimidine reductase
MRALLPSIREDVDLSDFYGQDWLGVGGIRADMLCSVDGAATASGKSAGLQTPGDNRVFATLRRLSDVVLVGSRTAMIERYGPVEFAGPALAERRDRGLPDDLQIAVLSRSLDLDLEAPLFAEPLRRPIVLTVAAADGAAQRRGGEVADVAVCGEQDIDFGRVRAALADRGLTHVVCEGGPIVLTRLIEAGELDELCLSITPFLAGPPAPRIVAGHPWTGGLRRLGLHSLLEEDGALFLRYRTAAAVS